jgi:SPIRAL1-like protein|uniref:Protein SPIRAL1-like 1 n=1 Tax=Fagus sylvatica TaxID=28930 RepID=A0A2N9J5Q5_FAGSY
MGRGVSSGGGQSSLGYLFGSGEAPAPAKSNAEAAPKENVPEQQHQQPVGWTDILLDLKFHL